MGSGLEALEEGCERGEIVDLCGHGAEVGECGWDVVEEMAAFPYESEETVGAEGLHEALHGAELEGVLEVGWDLRAVRTGLCAVIGEEFVAFGVGEGDVGIEEDGGEVVLSEPVAHALEVDEAGVVVADDDVLGLEIAVDEEAGEGGEFSGDGVEARLERGEFC